MTTFCAKQNKTNKQKPLPIEVTQGDNSNGGQSLPTNYFARAKASSRSPMDSNNLKQCSSNSPQSGDDQGVWLFKNLVDNL